MVGFFLHFPRFSTTYRGRVFLIPSVVLRVFCRGRRYIMMFSTTWLEFKDMAQDPLVSREPVSASCNRRPEEVLETHKYSLCTKEHPANCPLR